MEGAVCIPATTQKLMADRSTRIVLGVNPCTSSPYTPQLQGKRPIQGTDWLFATRSSGKKNVQLAQQGL
jgi:hypothetical protein